MSWAMHWAESGLLPDAVIRWGIRRLLRERLAAWNRLDVDAASTEQRALIERWRSGPLAVHQQAANDQHYEQPPEFFVRMLGPRLKYSCCWWDANTPDLAAAEEAMLRLTCGRAEIVDGQRILELGCGWGSLSLWLAQQYRHAQITAVSNSHAQREFITARAKHAGLDNLTVLTHDVAQFATNERFDRVVSIEMFEHFRNHAELLRRIAGWLTPAGKLFVHIFVHRQFAYPFEVDGDNDWMARNFFTGGVMPSDALLLHYAEHLAIDDHWQVSGTHYSRTLEAWLAQLDADRGAALREVAPGATQSVASRRLQQWRMFLLACSELFAYHGGREWHVSHYRLQRHS